MGSFRRALCSVVFAFVCVGLSTPPAHAVKAYPHPIVRYQPDGTKIEVRMIGDERIVFNETPDGYTIVRDAKGWWVYADPASAGQAALKASTRRVIADPLPLSWPKHIRPKIDPSTLPGPPFLQQDDGSIGALFRANKTNASKVMTPMAVNRTPTTVPVLVILVDFTDDAAVGSVNNRHTTGAGTPKVGEPDYQPIAGQPNTTATWQTLFGDRTVPGGLNHYYWEASYGRLQWNVKVAPRGVGQAGGGTLTNGGWYVSPNSMKYWGEAKTGMFGACDEDKGSSPGGIKDLVTWAVQAADPDVNYAAYDTNNDGTISDAELMIFVVHAREGQENYGSGCDNSDPNNERIWSHKWNMRVNVSVDGKTIPQNHIYAIEPEFAPGIDRATNSIIDKYFGVGVYAHEALHTLGAPDIYDTDYDAVPAGAWDLMDSGSYNGAKSGTHPAHMGGPLKQDIKLNADTPANSYGFIDDTEITDVATAADGIKNIGPFGTGNGVNNASNVIHRFIAPNDTTEWFMFENRAAVGYYDRFLPENGILIWHRDTGVSGSSNSTYPYQAAVERKGWANTTTGLNSSESAAALSYEDGETQFTASTDPSNRLHTTEAALSGIKDVKCVSAEGSSMSYVYGALSGPNPNYGGATVSGGTDNDPWIDNGETATLAVKVYNSSCASTSANGVSVSIGVAADSEIPASAVTISPASASVGDIAANGVTTTNFNVTLTCNSPGDYKGKSIKFAYTISGSNFTNVTGSFFQNTDKDYLFFDNAEGSVTGWSSTAPFDPSACASATQSSPGAWNWQNPTDRVFSGTRSYHTPEASANLMKTDAEEVWVSPNITVPAGISLQQLQFWHAAAIPCAAKTRARVWISTDNGATWTRTAFYKDAGDLSWEQTSIPLSAFAGATQIKMMFAVYTYECWSAGTACATSNEGWYIDDIGVVVDEQTPCVACTPPAAPTGVTATASAVNRITLGWSAVSGASTYKVYRSGGSCPAGTFTLLASGIATTSYVDNTVIAPNAYSYKVTAVDSTGNCESSQSSCSSTFAYGECFSAPTFSGLTSTTQSAAATCTLNLSWSAATSTCGNGVTYSIYRSIEPFTPDASTRIETGVTGTAYADTSALLPSTTYFYIVRAVDARNGVEEQNVVQQSATTVAGCTSAPLAVQAFTVRSTGDAGTGSNLLEWLNPRFGAEGSTITINYRTDQPPTSPTDGTVILSNRPVVFGAADSYNDVGVPNGTTRYYAIWVRY